MTGITMHGPTLHLAVNDTLWLDLPMLKELPQTAVPPSSYVIPVPLKEGSVLLFQGLTGAIDILSTADYQRFFMAPNGRMIGGGSPRQVGGPVQLGPEQAQWYQRGYFLTAKQEGEIVQSINARLMGEAKEEPMCFFLAPTNHCAVGCNYCIESDNPKKAKRVSLDPERVASAFETMKRLQDECGRKDGYILLFGGEPMQPFAMETIKDILAHCQSSGLKIFCFTSGISLAQFAPVLADHLDVLLGVCVTLDGEPEFHDGRRTISRGFELASKGIDQLLALGVPTMVRTNVLRESFPQIEWLKEFYESRGWWTNSLCSFELNILTNHGNFEGQDSLCPTHAETASFFLEKLRQDPSYSRFRFIGLFSHLYYGAQQLGLLDFHAEELGLHARVPRIYGCPSTGLFSFTLDADGSIRMCNEQVGSKDAPVGRYWPYFDLDRKHMSEWERRTPEVLDLCRECNHRFYCGGGCSLRSMREEGITQLGSLHADLNKGICGGLQSDFQVFFSRYGTEFLEQRQGGTDMKGHRNE